MKIKPDYHFSVLCEGDFPKKRATIEAQLMACREEGIFESFDGQSLYYEFFRAEDSRAAVVVAHGLSEFTGKYRELAWYLLNQGYDVFLYDQRCHGKSCRLTDRMDMIHVNRFSDYQKDMDCFVRDVVRKATELPLYLYAHSMGGAVAIRYLAEHPDVFQKAVLSAPMIQPLTRGVPAFVARWGLAVYTLFVDGKQKFWSADEYDPDYPFERSHDQSRSRFMWNMRQRHENPCYCTTPQTIRWVQQAVSLRAGLTSRRLLKKIKAPTLLICAENDGTVSTEAQQVFAQRCQMCEAVVIPNSTHAMLCGTKEVITEHVQLVLRHFA